MPLHTHVFSFTHNAVVLSGFRCVHPENQTKIFDFYILWIKTNVAYTRLEMIARTKYCTTTTASNRFVTLYCKLLPAVRSPSKHGRWRSSLLLYSISMILTCIFFTFNWLTLTSEMNFVKFHPVAASCLLSRGKRKYAPLGMRLLWKYIRNYFLVYQLISPFLIYLQNYKEFEAEILDLQSEKYGLSFDIKKYTTSGWALRDENVIGIRAFKIGSWALRSKVYSDDYLVQYFYLTAMGGRP